MSEIKFINKGNGRIVIGPVRLSYAYLTEMFDPKDGTTPIYKADLLIPADDAETVAKLKEAIEECVKYGVSAKWSGKRPAKLQTAFHEPDATADSEQARTNYILRVKSRERPEIVGINKQPIADTSQIYSGMWAYVSVSLFPYLTAGKSGIGAIMGNVLKFRDDERLGGGRPSAASDFSDLDISPEITEELI